MKDMRGVLQELKPALLMVLTQITSASTNMLYKVALNDGVSIRVVTAYRLTFATAFAVLLALIFERGSLFHNLFFGSIAFISATYSTAISNLIPVVTFVLAFFCGLEKLNIRTLAGNAKVFGTIIGIGGSMLLTFVKGPETNIWTFHIHLLHKHGALHSESSRNKILGILCAFGSCFSYAIWLIIQTSMSKEYSSHYSATALMSIMGALQSAVFALCVEKDWSQWKLGWNIMLLTAAYAGFVSCLTVSITAYCVRGKGPLYASIFSPLSLVIVAIAANLMLDENLYLGSIIGAVLIVGGLYMVLWGKSKENTVVPTMAKETIQEVEAIEIVVTPTVEHDNNDRSNNRQSNDATDEHEITEIENDGKEEDIASKKFSKT
ncbi:hypothetical protein RIF29_29234 [Crotalaria pallida]|uniref:WAT1-related protein n=1 Tax=Crotalaria pallida TaxID=3830 RepID=A0AAN9EE53_CROPI